MDGFVWNGWNLAAARRVLDQADWPYRLEGGRGMPSALVISQEDGDLFVAPGAVVRWDGERFHVERRQ